MKKTMLAVLCLAMTAMTTMANNENKAPQGKMIHPRHMMVDPVINMEVVGQMGLSEKKVQQIAELKVKKQDEMKALRAQHQPKEGMKQHHGKKHDVAPEMKHHGKKHDVAAGKQHHGKKHDVAAGKQHHAANAQHAQKHQHHDAQHAQMKAINDKYRKQMQDIMGTKTYVAYVEKVNDRLAMHQAHGKRHK